MFQERFSRREFLRRAAAGAVITAGTGGLSAESAMEPQGKSFRLRYILGSSMYGNLKLAQILPEARKTGAAHIDIWPKKHGTQREQMEAMGHDAFAAMLREHNVRLGMLTHYDLGPFGLRKEMKVAGKFGAKILIAGGMPKDRSGAARFVEKMKPHVAAAEAAGVTIGIENHGESYDAIRWFAEAARSKHIGVALAPYHLKPRTPRAMAKLIADLDEKLVHFYAWQHGMGCHKKLPKRQELLQMPGRGDLDFTPLLRALKKIRYTGWTEIFMHPVPRGIPILPTAAETTREINRARDYLDRCLAGLAGATKDRT